MVENVGLKGTVVMLSGDGGKGKSLLMQQLLSSAALGRDWLGLGVASGKGLLISCEDDEDELWRRQEKINNDLLCSMTDVCEGGLAMQSRVGQENLLVAFDRKAWRVEATSLFRDVWDYCLHEGTQYVVIDTATATYGGNQNDEQQVSAYITLLRRLAMRIQGVVILTKHPSFTGRANGTGESGSVTWNNSVRSRIYLHEDKDEHLVLKTVKSNYGASGGSIPLIWENGVFIRDEPADRAGSYSSRWGNGYANVHGSDNHVR
jgi:RecA-family ATPase